MAHAELGVCVADKPENSQETGYQGTQSKSIESPSIEHYPAPLSPCLLIPAMVSCPTRACVETLSLLSLLKFPLEASLICRLSLPGSRVSGQKKIHHVIVLCVRSHKKKKPTLGSGGPSLGPALLSTPGPDTDFPSFSGIVWPMGNVGNIGQNDSKTYGSSRRYSSLFTWVISLGPKPRPSREVKAQNSVIRRPRLWLSSPFVSPGLAQTSAVPLHTQSTAPHRGAPQPHSPQGIVNSEKR